MNAAGERASSGVLLVDLDRRLVGFTARTVRLQVLVDHDSQRSVHCPTCRWAVDRGRPACPSYAVALCLLENRALPSWLAHLADQVPGARIRAEKPGDDARRAEEDAAAGLFPAPRRVRPRGTGT